MSTSTGLTHSDYHSIHLSAKKSLPIAVEFEQAFSDVDHFIVHFGFHGNGEYEWQSTGFFDGRFQVAYSQLVNVDYTNKSIRPIGNPKFIVNEIVEISEKRGGRLGVKYGKQWKFSLEDWEKFCKSKQFSLLKFPEKQAEPISGIEKHIRKTRKPRIAVSLLSKKVVNSPDSAILNESKAEDKNNVKKGK